MKYKLFSVKNDCQIDSEINTRIEQGYEFVQVITSADGVATSSHKILMRISKENDPTEKLAATIRKTIANIKADPTNPVNVALAEALSNLRRDLAPKA